MKSRIPSFVMTITALVFIMLFFRCGVFSGGDEDKYISSRTEMVAWQIKARGIKDVKVLDAMMKVPRHEFVPGDLKPAAYNDSPLPIGYGQTISQPYIVALMTELLSPGKNSRVLEVGTGSGYQAAVLAEIVKEVYTIEIVKGLHDKSDSVLKSLGYKNIKTRNSDGYFGWKEHGPFDAIIVTCASEFIPPPLISQLKTGGVMCIPVGPPFKVQHLLLVKKLKSGGVETTVITSVRFVPLVRKEE